MCLLDGCTVRDKDWEHLHLKLSAITRKYFQYGTSDLFSNIVHVKKMSIVNLLDGCTVNGGGGIE